MNIFANIPTQLPSELTQVLLEHQKLRIERIVSKGHLAPTETTWYDQNENEWVIVLRGQARLQFEAEAHERQLAAGDYLHIPAHSKHRVTWTDPHAETIWLALFY